MPQNLSDHARLICYSFLTTRELISSIAKLSCNDRGLLPQSALLGPTIARVCLTQQQVESRGSFSSLAYILLVAKEVELVISLNYCEVGYEQENEGAAFIERVLTHCAEVSRDSQMELMRSGVLDLRGMRPGVKSNLLKRLSMSEKPGRFVRKLKLSRGTPSLALLLVLQKFAVKLYRSSSGHNRLGCFEMDGVDLK